MSFPRYPKYKDSGVEWLGEVPEGWKISPLKWLTDPARPIMYGIVLPGPDVGDGIPILKGGNVKPSRMNLESMARTTAEIEAPYARARLKGGDLVYAIRGSIGDCEIVPNELEDSNITQDVARVAVSEGICARWLRWALLAPAIREDLSSSSLGATIRGVNIFDLKRADIPTPPPGEQVAIANYLDAEVAKVDELVAEQRRLMELLKEKRQAIISHAVTKGLNPRAPMKPSGIEWLGHVPAHWDVKPLKYLMSLTSGGTPNKENLAYWDGNVPWASSKDLKSNELFDTQDHITQQALDDGAADLVPPGSILTVVRGMILLHTFPVVVARVPMAINQDLKAILPTAGVDADFLAWLLRGASDEVLGRTDEAGHGTKVLRMETWLAMPAPVPPLKEQTLITANIIKQRGELDALAGEAQKAIDLLQERRTALISAAVTGQIDVRKLAAS